MGGSYNPLKPEEELAEAGVCAEWNLGWCGRRWRLRSCVQKVRSCVERALLCLALQPRFW